MGSHARSVSLSLSLSLPPLTHGFVSSLTWERYITWVQQLPGPIADCVGSQRLSFNNKAETLDTGFVLALQRTQVDFFHGGMEGDGTLESQWAASIPA